MRRGKWICAAAAVAAFAVAACNSDLSQTKQPEGTEPITQKTESAPLFTQLNSQQTGIAFKNLLEERPGVNPYYYVNIYNGGGVAVGDVNNDDLPDVYFTGNMVDNKLYINKGNWEFEDVTEKAGVDGGGGWCTGANMADVNSDGFLDIYVCRAFNTEKPNLRENLLYINNGNGTFREAGAEFGLNDSNHSTQSVFFDYDKDGDLDMYLGNNPRKYNINIPISIEKMANPAMEESDKLYRNNGDATFTDVTKEAGILNYGFMLGAMAGDLNQDGWPDLYVANDHQEPDKMYFNNGDGTFTDVVDENVRHISFFSMGMDMADINNDCLLDFVVVDMMADDNYRQKTQMKGMAPDVFWHLVDLGWHYQYMHNMMQINNGNGTFSEIGYLAGITNTDWSWSPLLADFDHDGLRDLYVSNGYKRDSRDNDFLIAEKKLKAEANEKGKEGDAKVALDGGALTAMMGTTPLPNYFFKNNGDYTFSDVSQESGLDFAGFSNGAIYADMDGDGDLDILVNNLMDKAGIYRNNAVEQNLGNWLRVEVKGSKLNPHAVGAQITLDIDGTEKRFHEIALTRGFQSSVTGIAHFGLAQFNNINEITVRWPDGRVKRLQNVKPNQLLIVNRKDSETESLPQQEQTPLFVDVTTKTGADFTHVENEYNDMETEILLPHKMSQFGPALAAGDVNGDGNEDFYIGGAIGQTGKLFTQNGSGSFTSKTGPWNADKAQEDVGAALFDADGDGDLDLYVSSGGNEFPDQPDMLQDRLYLNDGSGSFTKASDALPTTTGSGSCVVPQDVDGDGDLDLLVGGRVNPGKYPTPARSYVLRNDGGNFSDATEEICPGFSNIGLVSSAVFSDVDSDGDDDLLLVGEWMSPTVYINDGGTFANQTESFGLSKYTGWWNRIVAADLDNDGDDDYLVGNLGLNYKYQGDDEEPVQIYCHDFDQSGTLDIVLGYWNDGTCFPVRGRQCSSDQMPFIKKKFPTYDAFGKATLQDVYGDDLKEALHYQGRYFATSILINDGGKLTMTKLPNEVQFSTVNGFVVDDFDGDGHKDILLAGNLFVSEVETGRADAGIGLLLKGDGANNFKPVPMLESGWYVPGDVRDLVPIKGPNGMRILVPNNDDKLQVFEVVKPAG